MRYVWFWEDTLIGTIGIAADDDSITNLYFGKHQFDETLRQTPLIRRAFLQLEEYWRGERKYFDLPISPSGTAFQQMVWKALMEIPYGGTRSYKQLAAEINKEKAYRAVGMANYKNPIPIIIPCHRVIGSDGSLTGYLGGLEVKKMLLTLEKQNAKY